MRRLIRWLTIYFVFAAAVSVSAQGIPEVKKASANCKEPAERMTTSKTWKSSGSKLVPLRTAIGDLNEDARDERSEARPLPENMREKG